MKESSDSFLTEQLQPVLYGKSQLLQEKEQLIPGSVQYTIKRFKKTVTTDIQDKAIMVYHLQKDEPQENYLELKFCISGNTYCRAKNTECDSCKFNHSINCDEKLETVDLVSLIKILIK